MVLAAAVTWGVAHIANVGPLAVATNVVLVVSLGSLARRRNATEPFELLP